MTNLGPQGEEGKQGSRGEPGPHGRQGEPGVSGGQGHGERGSEGAQGERGTEGAQGDRGGEGSQGKRGTQGEPGPHGRQGEPGVSGGQGQAGQRGERGPTGDTAAVVEVARELQESLDENTAVLDRVLRRQRWLTVGGVLLTVLLVVVALYAFQARRVAVQADEATVSAEQAITEVEGIAEARAFAICVNGNKLRASIRDFVLGLLGEPDPAGDPAEQEEDQSVRDRVNRDFADVECPVKPR